MTKGQKSKIVVIGWDAADWKMINPLLDQGLMPSLESLVNQGTIANLKTLDPPLSPMLWTSIATGMRPYKHGVHGFVEVEDEKVRPIYVNNRKVKAIWNILMQEGYDVNQVAWWPSHPVEPVNGAYVSNLFHLAEKNLDQDWPLPADAVSPKELEEIMAECRVHPQELTEAHILPFAPNAARLDQSKLMNQKLLSHLRKVIAEASSVHAASTYILEHRDWDFFACYLDAIDHFAHGFMKYHPPKPAYINQEDFDMWNYVMTAAYRFHDMMLGRILELIPDDAYVFLVSDHGFHHDHRRLSNLIKAPAGPADEHSQYGVLLAKGPGIKKDEHIFGASVLDITPTILHALDLPVGLDMDGKVLSELFTESREIKTIPSWEEVEGEAGQLIGAYESSGEGLSMALERLEELGYVSNVSPEKGEANVEQVMLENEYYLAKSYLDGGKIEEATLVLERIHEQKPDEYRYVLPLIHAYLLLGLFEKAEPLIGVLEKDDRNFGSLLFLLKGRLNFEKSNYRESLKWYLEAERLSPDNLSITLQLGRVSGDLERWGHSFKYYKKALRLDDRNADAIMGMGISTLRMKKPEKAMDYFLESIALNFENAGAHHFLGEALYRLKLLDQAAQALEISLRMNPGLKRSLIWLKKVYTKSGSSPARLKEIEQALSDFRIKELIVVSGLPRSGTSMMMGMLQAGGIKITSDAKRHADESNPKGYFELEAVKTLHKDSSFLSEVQEGSALKVISHQLLKLPNNYHYKVIFMRRPLAEVLQSQHKMLERDGKSDGKTYSLSLEENFRRNVRNVELRTSYRGNFEILYLDFHEVHAYPAKCAQKVAQFLEQDLDINAMAAAVDPNLHREKVSIS